MHRRIVRAIVLVGFASSFSVIASAAQAQFRRAAAEPNYWVGLSVGYVDGMSMTDNPSNATWNFGSSTQIRATFEKKLDNGVTGGIAAGFATAPLTYTPTVFSPSLLTCSSGCQANADMTQYMVFIRGGGGIGFHAIYNLEGGITQFGNFREQGTNAKLAPTSAASDASFGFGGGFAYGVSAGSDIYAMETYEYILHKQLSSTTTSAPRANLLRAGIRFGF
ncbi:MAG: hypothetical protein ABI442_16575 [Gemmatimonadaceae bacterium]